MDTAAPASNQARFDQIQAEQTRALYRNCPIGVVAAAAAALMLAATLHGPSALSTARAYGWSGLVAACALTHLILCVGYHRRAPPVALWRRWNYWFLAVVFAEGLAWCLGAFWFLADGNAFRALVLLLAWSGVTAGAIVVFGAFLRAYLLFIYPAMIPHILFLVRHPYPFSGTVLWLLGIYMLALPTIVYWLKVQMIEGHRLRFANADLANDMREQKDRADQANLAKSSFLAAASHDLRQPVHALGLFLGALRSRRMDAEARRLVDHIDHSVGALDDLFTSLLDISKLDAGTVQADPTSIAIAPLLARLCADYAGEAAAKGIALRCVGCSLAVRSDPVLLERIVRNLLSNAVRYTVSGGVVIGCRRRGAGVALEVWDSGAGIAADQHERIFQEFFQIGNTERDRTKGLGLGLAIVRRLAVLIEAPLELRSQPGKGSVFRLLLPRAGHLPGWASDRPEPSVRSAPKGALILVIDDETAIQQAMHSLLSSWGHRVVVAGSSEELAARLGGATPSPDLIICDYRLRGAETGVAVIADIRRRFGLAIPAMLITGDTAPDRILEARASGFLLLHKPLANAKLRAAVGNLLRAGSPPDRSPSS